MSPVTSPPHVTWTDAAALEGFGPEWLEGVEATESTSPEPSHLIDIENAEHAASRPAPVFKESSCVVSNYTASIVQSIDGRGAHFASAHEAETGDF